jgi:hypothetical protein
MISTTRRLIVNVIIALVVIALLLGLTGRCAAEECAALTRETARLRIAHAAGVAENDGTYEEVSAQPSLMEVAAK